MSEKKRILLVEDEENFGSLLQNYLQLSDFEVVWKRDGAQGYSAFSQRNYDVCIFDVMMPTMDGFTLTEKIRDKDTTTPIIFLTARNMRDDMIKGYKIGADDYLSKPFDIEILLLKLEALFQRKETNGTAATQHYQIGTYSYDPATRVLSHAKESKKLSPKEGALMQLLCDHFNQVMPRDKALRKIWGEDNYFTTRSMDVYITKLRKYLQYDDSLSIQNVHSSGYMLGQA